MKRDDGDLRVSIMRNGRTARLEMPIAAECGVTVPVGFVTDFASVPRILWWAIPPWGPYSRAAVVHDYAYRFGSMPRAAADLNFLRMMSACGVGFATRTALYVGVRLFGGAYYNRRRASRRPRPGAEQCH
jgi:hypothetical protein